MRIRLVRRPGQPGTKALAAQYGDALVCVRYRYDSILKKRHKTIELIIETIDWMPPTSPETIVQLRVAIYEREIQSQIRSAGGHWNKNKQVWEVRYDKVVQLKLVDRIVTGHSSS